MVQEFHYQVPWRSHSARPGHHKSSQSGGRFEFHGHAPLISNPDPRNIDIHASLHDPFGQFFVRTFRQQSTIPVFVVADLSASMGFHGTQRKLDLLVEFAGSVAYSASRSGDAFGFIPCAEDIILDLMLPLQWHKGRAIEYFEKLATFKPSGRNSSGLHQAVPLMGKKRALVFLVSDFHFPISTTVSILNAYNHHDLVPVVIWDSSEYDDLPKWGLTRFRDPETAQERALFMRPALHAKIKSAFEQRRNQLIDQCLRQGREPLFVVNQFCADDVTQYFFGEPSRAVG